MQIVYSQYRGSRSIEHIGSAHCDGQVEVLKAAASARLRRGQGELDLGPGVAGAPSAGVLAVTGSRMGHLLDAFDRACEVLGFAKATGDDEVFKALVVARIIEPTSKQDSLRVLDEAGAWCPSYRTVKRRLAGYGGMRRVWVKKAHTDGAQDQGVPAGPSPPDGPDGALVQVTADEGQWVRVLDPDGGQLRARLAKACVKHTQVTTATFVLYDVTTLWFETNKGDGFRESGFSKERRLEPQILVGLLTDAAGFPLMVHAFDGNTAETTTMIPVIEAFCAAHGLKDVVIVADAGMISEGNKMAIEKAGWSFILGAKVLDVPHVIQTWRQTHPGTDIPDGQVFTQPWPAGPKDKRKDQTLFYTYKADRARRTLHGIDQQVAKAVQAAAGHGAIKRNRFLKLTGATKSVNRELEAKARALAGIKGYVTNLPDPDPHLVIGTYARLVNVEKSFRMSKSDLAARPIYHHARPQIEAHLTIVFAALAVARWIEATTGWSIRKFVTTTRRYRTIQIQAGKHTVTAADPLPPDLKAALSKIHDTTPTK